MRTTRNTPPPVRWLAVAVVMALSSGSSGYAAVISLDADYVGTAGWHTIFWPRSAFGASGTNASASSGFTRAGINGEGYVDAFGDGGFYPVDGLSSLSLFDTNGDTLAGSFQGQGTIYNFSGTFTITGGTGQLSGATGAGTFSLQAGTYEPVGYSQQAPATLSIRGTANVAAVPVPEPGSLALLVAAALPLAARRRRAR